MKATGIYSLSPEHADAIQRLLSDPDILANTRLPEPLAPDAAQTLIARRLEERAAGKGHPFAILDGPELVGICGLHEIEGSCARELGYWVGRPYRGNGYASFALRMLLDFAFRTLQLERVQTSAFESNAASRRVLEKGGFQLSRIAPHRDPLLKRPHEKLAHYEITASRWRDSVHQRALSTLYPALAELLRAELAAGNEIAETGGGWPDPDSVFVRVRYPFRARPDPLPEGVQYLELNDPHWWKAEYNTRSPRHILAY
jgi:RimJ/RimL family protein N-acetyltransferase